MATATSTQIQENQYGFAPELAPYGQKMLGQAAALPYRHRRPAQQPADRGHAGQADRVGVQR